MREMLSLLAVIALSSCSYSQPQAIALSPEATVSAQIELSTSQTAVVSDAVDLFIPREEFYIIPLEIAQQKISLGLEKFHALTLNIFSLASPIQNLNLLTDEPAEEFSLLQFNFYQEKQTPQIAYERKRHYNGWVKNKKSGDCMNTRNKVLVRDNVGEIKVKASNPCSVETGVWNDPYAGETLTRAEDMQIDHMIPLKESYISGAWKWSFKARCLFGNYLGFKKHLIAVDGEQNNNKSDQTPIDYLPPRAEYQCEYLKDWLTIKALWSLNFDPSEKREIEFLIKKLNCDSSKMTISKKFIQEQAQFFKDNIELCPQFLDQQKK